MNMVKKLNKWDPAKYIKPQRNYITVENSNLPDNMKKCKHCNGAGIVSMNPDDPTCEYVKMCPLCKGEGYVDWITYAIGYVEPKGLDMAWHPTDSNKKPKWTRRKVNDKND